MKIPLASEANGGRREEEEQGRMLTPPTMGISTSQGCPGLTFSASLQPLKCIKMSIFEAAILRVIIATVAWQPETSVILFLNRERYKLESGVCANSSKLMLSL